MHSKKRAPPPFVAHAPHTLFLLTHPPPTTTMGKELDAPKEGMEVDGAGADGKAKAAAAGAPPTPTGPAPVPAVLAAAAALMDRAAKAKDVRGLPNRALRLTAGARGRFDGAGLTDFLEATFPAGDEVKGLLGGAVAQVWDGGRGLCEMLRARLARVCVRAGRGRGVRAAGARMKH